MEQRSKAVSVALRVGPPPSPAALAVAESRFEHLYKVNFDNMESYMEKKRLRLEQQKSHWGKKRMTGDGNKTPGKKRSKENKVK